jgi:hypothetical protein
VTFAFTYQTGQPVTESVHVAGKGRATASVDFSSMTGDDVIISGGSALVILPDPELSDPVIDTNRTTVSVNGGPAAAIGNADPDTARQALRAARQRLTSAADQPRLVAAAEAQARSNVSQLFESLGYTSVTVYFRPGP